MQTRRNFLKIGLATISLLAIPTGHYNTPAYAETNPPESQINLNQETNPKNPQTLAKQISETNESRYYVKEQIGNDVADISVRNYEKDLRVSIGRQRKKALFKGIKYQINFTDDKKSLGTINHVYLTYCDNTGENKKSSKSGFTLDHNNPKFKEAYQLALEHANKREEHISGQSFDKLDNLFEKIFDKYDISKIPYKKEKVKTSCSNINLGNVARNMAKTTRNLKTSKQPPIGIKIANFGNKIGIL